MVRISGVGPQWKSGDLWFKGQLNKISEIRTGIECIGAVIIPKQNKTMAGNLFSQKSFEPSQMITKIRNLIC